MIINLKREVKDLEAKLYHKKLYNFKKHIIRLIINSGIALEFSFPFIVASLILSGVYSSRGNPPFVINQIVDEKSIEDINTSSGMHFERSSYDYDYKEEKIEYTTGWFLNENGLYEQTLTSFRIDKNIDLSNPEKIFSMSEEELSSALTITNKERIMKKNLSSDDNIYNDEGFIITSHYKKNTDKGTHNETYDENFANSFIYVIALLLFGSLAHLGLSKTSIRVKLIDALNKKKEYYNFITDEDIEKIRKIYEIKKDNLDLITGNCEDNDSFQYRLRKNS